MKPQVTGCKSQAAKCKPQGELNSLSIPYFLLLTPYFPLEHLYG